MVTEKIEFVIRQLENIKKIAEYPPIDKATLMTVKAAILELQNSVEILHKEREDKNFHIRTTIKDGINKQQNSSSLGDITEITSEGGNLFFRMELNEAGNKVISELQGTLRPLETANFVDNYPFSNENFEIPSGWKLVKYGHNENEVLGLQSPNGVFKNIVDPHKRAQPYLEQCFIWEFLTAIAENKSENENKAKDEKKNKTH